MPCFTAMRAEIALMSGSAFAVTHHAFSSGAGRTSDGNGSHASTLKSPSYTKSVSWQHYHQGNIDVSGSCQLKIQRLSEYRGSRTVQ
ncbi:putative IS1 encoded protein [Shigella flexneri K-315]|uniref:Putative IS1 encoded protein n=1 Tax=Shigella flexneri K-315 TaxID=766150 RepID=I6CZT7_SHIFL|nr:putative IS1 encoded protein [Shigella flexneri K-315]